MAAFLYRQAWLLIERPRRISALFLDLRKSEQATGKSGVADDDEVEQLSAHPPSPAADDFPITSTQVMTAIEDAARTA